MGLTTLTVASTPTIARPPEYQELKGRIHTELLNRLRLDKLANISRQEAEPELRALIVGILEREQQKTRITGRLSNRGPSSVDAVATPLGKYQKVVSDAIGARWYYYVKQKMDLVSVGTAHLEAQVDAQGKIQKLRVLSNNSNESFANICLQSFQEAQIPPIPPDLVATLPEGRLPVDIYFTTYPNR